MRTENLGMVSRYDVIGQVQTSLVSVEIRDTYVDVEGGLLLCSPEVLIGSPLTSIPRPSAKSAPTGEPIRYGDVGDVLFMPSEAPWWFQSGAGRFRTVTSLYAPDTLRSVTGLETEALEQEMRRSQSIRNPRISGALGSLAAEVQSPGFASAVMIEGLGLCLLADVARLLDAGRGPTQRPAQALSAAQLNSVRDYVMAAKARQPSLSELAQLCGLGRRTFTRRFRSATGQSVGPWIADQKVALAKQLLAGGSLSIKQIAFELGFSTPSNFSAAFRRAVGMTPTAFASSRAS